MDDRVCFNCDGSGFYAAKPCQFCAGSGLSTKLKAIFDRTSVLIVGAMIFGGIAALAFGKAFHAFG